MPGTPGIPGGYPPYSPDRCAHAMAAYAYFHGRECSYMDISRFLEADTLLTDRDHLLGRKTDFGIRFIGVVSAGFTIVDTSEGAPDWALNKAQGRFDAARFAGSMDKAS